MDDFQKQVEKELEKHKERIYSDIEKLCFLMRELDIDSKEKLDNALEFAELFSKLRSEGVIKKLHNK
jgi:hypothetical protein